MTALTDFFASPNNMEGWSRKNSGCSMPAHPDEIDLRVRE